MTKASAKQYPADDFPGRYFHDPGFSFANTLSSKYLNEEMRNRELFSISRDGTPAQRLWTYLALSKHQFTTPLTAWMRLSENFGDYN